MNFKLVKLASYSALASVFGTGVILPSWGYFSLYKKNQKLEESLRNAKNDLENANKEAEKIKNDAIQNKEIFRQQSKQTRSIKFQNLLLGWEKTKAIKKIKSSIEKIKKRNLDSLNSWTYWIYDNKDVAAELEKTVKLYEKFLNSIPKDQ